MDLTNENAATRLRHLCHVLQPHEQFARKVKEQLQAALAGELPTAFLFQTRELSGAALFP
jgi:hypothetical protein